MLRLNQKMAVVFVDGPNFNNTVDPRKFLRYLQGKFYVLKAFYYAVRTMKNGCDIEKLRKCGYSVCEIFGTDVDRLMLSDICMDNCQKAEVIICVSGDWVFASPLKYFCDHYKKEVWIYSRKNSLNPVYHSFKVVYLEDIAQEITSISIEK